MSAEALYQQWVLIRVSASVPPTWALAGSKTVSN